MFGNGSHTVACPHLVDTLTNCPSKNFEEVCQVQVCVQTLREFKLRHKNTTRQIRSHIFNFFAKQDLELQTSLNSGKGIIQSSLHAVLHVNSTPPNPPDATVECTCVHTFTALTFKTQCNRVLIKTNVASP